MASNSGDDNWGGGNVSVPTPYPTTPQDAVKQFLRMGGDPTATVMMLNVDFASKFPGIHIQLIKSGLGAFFFPTKKAFSDAVSALDVKEAEAIAASVNIPAAAVDAPVSTLSPVRTGGSGGGSGGGTGGGSGGGNGFSGYRIVASSPIIENVNTGEELPVAPEEEPEMTTAIIPYTPTITPADAADAIMRDPARFVNRTDMSKAAIANMFMAVIIKSLKKGAIGAATGSWYLISSLISYLGEEIEDRDTLLAAMRNGAITRYDQLAYSHDLLTKISKQIISKTRSAGPSLIVAAAEAYSAGQEALLTAYNMFGALATVRRLYPDIKETLAPGLQIKRAGLDSAECNLLKAYVLFVNAIINKYEKRRIFANEWLSLDERLRRDIIRDSESKSFIASLFSKIGLFRGRSEPELNINAGGASQTEYYGAQNVGHTGSSGVIKALITENEMRMINALVASILSDDKARCTPANLKAEMRDILEMKEADVPNIRSVERFRSLHNAIVRERTTGSGGGGGMVAAALAGPSRNFGGLFDPAAMAARRREMLEAAQEGAPSVPLAEQAGRFIGAAFAAPVTGTRAVFGAARKATNTTTGAIRTAAGQVARGFANTGGAEAASIYGSAARTGATVAGALLPGSLGQGSRARLGITRNGVRVAEPEGTLLGRRTREQRNAPVQFASVIGSDSPLAENAENVEGQPGVIGGRGGRARTEDEDDQMAGPGQEGGYRRRTRRAKRYNTRKARKTKVKAKRSTIHRKRRQTRRS